MIYSEPSPASRDDVVAAIREGDGTRIVDALLGLTLHGSEWRWTQDRCLALLDHPSTAVRACAVTCLGHLARIHGKLDTARVVPALRSRHDVGELSGRIDDAMDDIARFAR